MATSFQLPKGKDHLAVTFSRVALVAFALRLLLVAIGRSERGRQLTVKAEDGKVFDVVFRI